MNILWIYNMPLDPEAGGTERITSLVAQKLRILGHKCLEVLVFSERGGVMTYLGKTVTDLHAFLKEKKIDIVINQIAYATWLIDTFLAYGGRKWCAEGGKLISCLHFDPCNPDFVQLLMSKEQLTLTDKLQIIKHKLLPSYYTHKKERQEGEIYNKMYDNSDAFVILSDTHRPYLRKVMQRVEYDKLIAINNPLTFDRIISEKELDKKKKIMLVCARMSEYHKRISLILKAWQRLQRGKATDGWALKLIGEGPDLERYRKQAAYLKITDVEFCGRQAPLPYYQEASILLLTSSAEGWGLSLTEALQNGAVPVVMNSSPVYTDIIKNGYNGYLTPNGDEKTFANHIKALTSNPRLLRAMQMNAIASASCFSIDKTIGKWEALLSKISE